MLNQSELSNLNKGEAVDHFLMVRKCEIRLTKNNKEYLSLDLGDKSQTLSANVWDNFDSIYNSVKVGDVVKVKGSIDDFQGTPQIRVAEIRKLKEDENVLPSDFMAKSKRDFDEMKNEFWTRVEKISNTYLKTLLKAIFNENNFEKYSLAPAGKSWHHSYIHGLLEHTLEIVKICDLMCDIHPEINRDLLISGAFLHDFGKTEELSYDSSFEYTDKGKLIGHIVISAMLINEETKKIPNFPVELKENLIHIVLSHQGKLEFASPVVPKTLEAITMYQADELSAKVNAYKNAIASGTKPDSSWTKFISLASTDLYNHNLPSDDSEDTNKTLFD